MDLWKEHSRVTNVYGRILSRNLESLKQALLPEIRRFSTDFITWQVGKILYGKSVQNGEKQLILKNLIENCQVTKLKVTPEIMLFQPKWRHSELFEFLERNHTGPRST